MLFEDGRAAESSQKGLVWRKRILSEHLETVLDTICCAVKCTLHKGRIQHPYFDWDSFEVRMLGKRSFIEL